MTSNDLRIRFIEPEDYNEVFEIWDYHHKNTPANIDKESIKSEFLRLLNSINDDTDFTIIVAEENQRIIGWIAAFPFEVNPYFKNEQAMCSSYILPQFQGKGLGKLLLERMLKYLENSKINSLLIQTDTKNIAAIKTVEKFGFNKIGKIPKSNKPPFTNELFLYVYNVPQHVTK